MNRDTLKSVDNRQAAKTWALLTPREMDVADSKAIASGIKGVDLMNAAGRAVAEAVMERWTKCPIAVLCGPGNNGGDGFVAARYLTESGWPVSLALMGERERLKGDAAFHAEMWKGTVERLSPAVLDGKKGVIDALFGSGLSRPLDGVAGQTIDAVRERKLASCAVDIPSGVDGATGTVQGYAAPAVMTVTFFRKKPGHLLSPGRVLCGSVIVANIGIPDWVLDEIKPQTFENVPELWPHAEDWRKDAALILDDVERARRFPGKHDDDDRVSSVRRAARESQRYVILRGRDTLIAMPDGRVLIGAGEPPFLSTQNPRH